VDAIELPVLRLGCAGFSAEQEAAIHAAAAASRITHWIFGPLAGADAWFVNGQVTQHLPDNRLRVASRQPGGRSLVLDIGGDKRPIAFALPVPATLDAVRTFDVGRHEAILEALGVFEFVLAPQAAEFLLASHIVDQQEALGAGAFEVRARGQLVAAVDMRGDAWVLPSVRPSNFDAALWKRVERARLVPPPNFVRVSMSELMWRYVSRSQRDLLPERYRSNPIFFRRPPRVDPVLVEEEHLLVMRELAIRPARFDELRQRLELAEDTLARVLATLYYVGCVTTTRSRATPTTQADDLTVPPRPPTQYGEPPRQDFELADLRLLTAPARFASA
jgi:hypothetical protein